MIYVGKYQELTIDRDTNVGVFLHEEDSETDVLLPHKFVPQGAMVGDTIRVFVYRDSEDRLIATTDKPLLTLGQFACLKVNQMTKLGAFLEWGVQKDLLVPFKNMAVDMEENRFYIVYMYLDDLTDRLVGTTKIRYYLKSIYDENIQEGDQVNLLVSGITEIGYQVIINNEYSGLLYKNEVPYRMGIGEKLEGYIKPFRPDGKIDVSINPIGYQSIAPGAQKILDLLKQHGGFLPFHDKSTPDDIRGVFGMSKKLFKKSLGSLYKDKIVTLEFNGFRLANLEEEE